MKVDTFIIDFDSTFIDNESFNLLTELILANSYHKNEIKEELKQINLKIMNSLIDFKDAFALKINLLKDYITKEKINKLSLFLENKVNPNIKNLLDIAEKTNKKIIVFSNSFKGIMKDIMVKNQIALYFANKFIFNEDGRLEDYERDNFMANNNGKKAVINFLKQTGLIFPDEKIMVIGDGIPDLQLYKDGLCDYFVNFAIINNFRLHKHRKNEDPNFIICKTEEDFNNFLKKIE